jgi:hypothetical protein
MSPVVIPTTRRAWLSADTVEWVLFPLLAAFAAGVIVGQTFDEQRLVAAERQTQHHAAALQAWRSACEPLLTLPVESTPEIVLVATPPAAAAGARP